MATEENIEALYTGYHECPNNSTLTALYEGLLRHARKNGRLYFHFADNQHELEPAANEAMLELLKPGPEKVPAENAAGFFYSTLNHMLMRNHAHETQLKRGGGKTRIPLDSLPPEAMDDPPPLDNLCTDELRDTLQDIIIEVLDGISTYRLQRLARIVPLRRQGLSNKKIARETGIDDRQIRRDASEIEDGILQAASTMQNKDMAHSLKNFIRLLKDMHERNPAPSILDMVPEGSVEAALKEREEEIPAPETAAHEVLNGKALVREGHS